MIKDSYYPLVIKNDWWLFPELDWQSCPIHPKVADRVGWELLSWLGDCQLMIWKSLAIGSW